MITTDNTKTLENALAEIEFWKQENKNLKTENAFIKEINRNIRDSERRRLAGMAMQALISDKTWKKELCLGIDAFANVSKTAINFADDLIAELDKGE